MGDSVALSRCAPLCPKTPRRWTAPACDTQAASPLRLPAPRASRPAGSPSRRARPGAVLCTEATPEPEGPLSRKRAKGRVEVGARPTTLALQHVRFGCCKSATIARSWVATVAGRFWPTSMRVTSCGKRQGESGPLGMSNARRRPARARACAPARTARARAWRPRATAFSSRGCSARRQRSPPAQSASDARTSTG